jgi:hypothetical protein
LEGVCRYAGELVIGAVHDEADPLRQSTKLADYQFVANERKMVKDIALEIFRAFRIVVIGVVSDQNVRILHSILFLMKHTCGKQFIGRLFAELGPFM